MSAVGTPLAPLQEGVHTILLANAALDAFLGVTASDPRVYDEVPKDQTHDYLVHGDAQEVEDDTMGRSRRIVDFAVEFWSIYRGSKRCKEAADLVIKALNNAAPTLTGWTVTKIVYKRTIIQRQDDLIARWAAIWFRAWLKEA